MALSIKRVYAPAEKSDGIRILVDRLWPRGISREKAKIDEWMKVIAPSTRLRQWVHAGADRWDEFQTRYRAEMDAPDKKALIRRLRAMSRKGNVTLLFASKDVENNNARALASIVKGGRSLPNQR